MEKYHSDAALLKRFSSALDSPTSMMQILRIEGSHSRRIGSITFYKCPSCGDFCDILSVGENELAKCFACGKSSPEKKFARIKKRRVIGSCARCGEEVPFIPSTTGIVGPLCPNFECSNYLAVAWAKSFVQPGLVLNPEWNAGMFARAERITSNLLLARCRSKKDVLILRVLQVLAKQDDERFKFGDTDEFCGALCFDAKRRKYIGFLIWTEDMTAVLRQLFVVNEERRKGHASKMVRFWVERYAKSMGDRFGIEGPNEAALKLHAKLGHIKIEGSKAIGIKCYFAPTF